MIRLRFDKRVLNVVFQSIVVPRAVEIILT